MSDTAAPVFSVFDTIREALGGSARLVRCTKTTLVHISHTLEDLVLSHQMPALLFTGFQESSHWQKETERYRALAEVAQQVCIFAGGQLPPESSASQLHITLRPDDPLRQEWFLAILSERFAVVLCGQDGHARAASEATRMFDTIWSFEHHVITLVLDRMEQVIELYRPERLASLREARARFPLRGPDPALVTQLTSELLRFEEELNRSLAHTTHELEQQLQWRLDLTETLVHDLRTPLQGIVQTLDFLRQNADLDRKTLEEMTSMALVSAANLSTLIQVILDTSRMEQLRLPIELLPMAPQQLFDEALGTVETMVRLAGLRFEQRIDPAVRVVWCDRGLIGRVLQNLVGNAIKFTPAGGLVTVELSGVEGGVRIRVRDSGLGIAPASLARIFDRYYRGPGRDVRSGSGIGLYFCRLAVEAHGGSIRADSALGSGTAITLTLPHRQHG